MRSMKRNIVLLTLLLISFAGNSQQGFPFLKADRTKLFDNLERVQISHLNNLYFHHINLPGEFIFGKEYVPYYFRSQENPILRFNEERSASLVFNGRSYDHIILQYDTFTDEVIYTDDTLIFNDRFCKVALNSDYVNGFDLYFKVDTLTFRYFRKDQDTTFNLKEGFYEVVFDSGCKFLIKYVSSRYVYKGIDEYYYHPVRYVKIRDGYSKLSSKKQFISLFGDRSEEVRQYLHDQKIKFRKADKKQIADVLKFYENLNSGVN